MSILLLLQLMLPLALIAWLGWRPLHSRAGMSMQIASTTLYVLVIAIVGLWTFLPWWVPFGFGLLLLLAVVAPAVRARRRPRLPVSLPEWISCGVFALLGCSAAWLAGAGLMGRAAPTSGVVALGFPLEPGRYLVVNGGNSVLVNAHLKTNDGDSRFSRWRGQSHGVDLIGITAMGFHARGLQPSDPRAYVIHGAGVLAPCSGTVRSIVDGLADNAVPRVDRQHMAGNHIVLACGGIEVVLGHLLAGSIQVAPGAGVKIGDHLAAVGNSGNSDEPHLHIHAQTPGTVADPFSGDPLHMFIADSYPVRNQRIRR